MTDRRRILIWGDSLYLASIETSLAGRLADVEVLRVEAASVHENARMNAPAHAMVPRPRTGDVIIVDTASCDPGAALSCLIYLPGVPVIALASHGSALTVLCSWGHAAHTLDELTAALELALEVGCGHSAC